MVTNGETVSLMTVEYIPVSIIDPSTLNRHCADDDPDVIELAQTIRQNGLISPISIRPRDGGRFEIICGERRWRAFRINGHDEIPCIVKNLDDTQAQIERIVENYQRRDPSFMEQGEAVAALMKLTDRDVAEVANRLGQSVSWVRRRSRLPNLIPAWKTELEKTASPYAHIRESITKLEEVSILPANTQKTLLEQNVLRYVGTVKEMRKAIAKHFMDLDEKPWTRAWEKKAFSGSGKKRCDACQRRSDRDSILFDNPDMPCSGKKMCLDAECWKSKCLMWCKHLLSSSPDMVPVMRGYIHSTEGTKLAEYFGVNPLSSWSWDERNEDAADPETGEQQTEEREGYTAAIGVYVDGPDIGSTVSIWLENEEENSDGEDTNNADMHEWRSQNTAAQETRQVFADMVKAEIAAYLADIDAHATMTPAELADRQLRAACWFGIAGYMESTEEVPHIDDPAWNPLAFSWSQTAEHIADYVATVTAGDITGFISYSYDETDSENAKALCAMFAIPLDLITTKALEELAEATGIGQDTADASDDMDDGGEVVAAFAEPLTDENDRLYFGIIPASTPAQAEREYPLVPVAAEFFPVA